MRRTLVLQSDPVFILRLDPQVAFKAQLPLDNPEGATRACTYSCLFNLTMRNKLVVLQHACFFIWQTTKPNTLKWVRTPMSFNHVGKLPTQLVRSQLLNKVPNSGLPRISK